MTEHLLHDARSAFLSAPPVGHPAYLRYCDTLRARLLDTWPTIVAANGRDLEAAAARGLPPVLIERLRMGDVQRLQLVALTAKVAAELPAATAASDWIDVADWGRLRRVPKPLGVLLMVYEARPTVTVEGALLPVVAGNAVLLRGGKEMAETDAALAATIRDALVDAGLPPTLVSIVTDPDRAVLRALLKRHDAIDVLIPRGSASLIDYCRSASSIPVIASGGGVNHLYVHRSADLERAAAIALDSKLAEPTACNTVEMILVDAEVAQALTDHLVDAAVGAHTPTTLRLGGELAERIHTQAHSPGTVRIETLEAHDFGREFLDATLGVLPVTGLEAALRHIREHGSAHTEGVLSTDPHVIDAFAARVDAAAIVVNGSLRLHDGPTLQLGSEISISTGRLHVRGSVTIGSLLTYSWLVDAQGALRADRSQ
ncbi:glutamate-5-semialdehyde dehydrogenase [Burkholderia gladioli]|uniref:glutamate-5-semialdehyde dehydrogenase n=1 Tax=Burkholderia gladioli TaxID=28095 RepID=UPI001641054D|nr:glutamate-5-semialdehyde dehydrogenase [Burkholderia gladioli]